MSVDAGFARDMAIHHQQAVELSFNCATAPGMRKLMAGMREERGATA